MTVGIPTMNSVEKVHVKGWPSTIVLNPILSPKVNSDAACCATLCSSTSAHPCSFHSSAVRCGNFMSIGVASRDRTDAEKLYSLSRVLRRLVSKRRITHNHRGKFPRYLINSCLHASQSMLSNKSWVSLCSESRSCSQRCFVSIKAHFGKLKRISYPLLRIDRSFFISPYVQLSRWSVPRCKHLGQFLATTQFLYCLAHVRLSETAEPLHLRWSPLQADRFHLVRIAWKRTWMIS